MSKIWLIALGALAGCASLTGVTDWRERTLVSQLSRDQTFTAATIAVGQVGRVTFSDPVSGTVTGECAQQVDASILVAETQGQTVVTLKSKINVDANMVVIETNDRENCLNQLETALRNQGA